jgi:hypothetical protein
LVRDDLDDGELAALEGQFPGLTARVRATRAAAGQQLGDVGERPDDGVQPLHPAPETPVDNVTDGVQPPHPATGTGCSHRSDGVQLFPERGAAIAPEPSIEPSIEPSAARAYAREAPGPVENPGEAAAEAEEFFTALGPRWLLTTRQRKRLVPAVRAALAAGWEPRALAEFAGANTAGVHSPYAVLRSRLSPGELPAPRPAWRRARHGAGPAMSATAAWSGPTAATGDAAPPVIRCTPRRGPPDQAWKDCQLR